jgi:hypothetical protein
MAKIIIHIGVGKTGTTTLQNNLFARHRGILNIGRPYTSLEVKSGVESLRDDDAFDYLSTVMARLTEAALASANGRTTVLSDETLVHSIHQSLIAARLNAAAPSAHILITVRNQYDLVASYWAAHGRILKNVPRPYRGKAVSFDDWFALAAEAKQQFFVRLDFWRLYRIYAEVFGSERVHIMTFEKLAADPVCYARDLAALMGVDEDEMSELVSARPVNRRPSGAASRYQSLRAWLLPHVSFSTIPGGDAVRRVLHRLIEAGSPLSVRLTQTQRDTIRERFGTGNRALAGALGIDLARLGYPMPLDHASNRPRSAMFALQASRGHE